MKLIYDAFGRKWFKHGEFGVTGYASGIEYHDGKIEAIYTPDGRMVAEYQGGQAARYRAEYFHQDHLGNTRLVFSDFNQNGLIELTEEDPTTPLNEFEITQEAHYYPFGMGHLGPWYETVAPENKYQYNGKELNGDYEINLFDYGWRWYDPAIARWGAIDPLAEGFAAWSPYNYALNNPIKLIDPDGAYVRGADAWNSLNEQLEYMDILERGGISYQGSAVNARSNKIGKGNILINIQGSGTYFQLDDLQDGNKNWDYVSATGLKDAVPWLEGYLRKHKLEKFNNVVIISHGNEVALSLYPTISTKDLELFSEGSLTGAAKSIKSVIWLASKMSDDEGGAGNLCFFGCKAGASYNGIGSSLANFLFADQDLNSFNMFFNTLSTRIYSGEDYNTFKLVWGKPVSIYGREYLKPGWNLYKKDKSAFINKDLIINKAGNPFSLSK